MDYLICSQKPISEYDLIKLIILEFNLNINLIPEKEKITTNLKWR